MGEENRGSSESSTVLIVVAILGGILLVGCLGGVAVVGAGLLWVRSEAVYQPPPVQMSVPPMQAMPRIVDEVAPLPPPAPLPPATVPSDGVKAEDAPLVVPGDEKQE